MEQEFIRARQRNIDTLGGDAFFLINKKLLKYFNGNWELCGLLSYFLQIEKQCIMKYKGQDKLCQEGYFFKQKEIIEEKTYLHFNKQTNLNKELKNYDLLDIKLANHPAKNYYRINHIKLDEIMGLDDEEIDSHLDSKSLLNQLTSHLESNSLLINNKVNNNISNIEDKSSIGTLVPSKTPLLIKKKKTTYSEAFVNLSTNTYNQAEEIFDYWNLLDKPLLHHDKVKEKCSYKDPYLSITFKMETKLFQEAIVAISKRLKGNSTKEEIKAAIKQYHDFLSDTDKFFIRNGDRLQVVDIANFFEFSKTNKDIQKNRKSTDPFKTIKSWYWECGTAVVKGEQYLIEKYGRKPKVPYQEQPIADQFPEITEGFKTVWKQQMAVDRWYHNGGGVKDENCFRRASVFLVDFYDRWWNKGLYYLSSTTNPQGIPMLISNPKSLVGEFIKAIEYSTEGMSDDKEITPAWLCGPGMEKRLLGHYRDQGILNDLCDQEEY